MQPLNSPGQLSPSSTTCRVMLCRDKPVGLVALNAMVEGRGQPVRVPSCTPCSEVVERALALGMVPQLTPDKALHFTDWAALLRGGR